MDGGEEGVVGGEVNSRHRNVLDDKPYGRAAKLFRTLPVPRLCIINK